MSDRETEVRALNISVQQVSDISYTMKSMAQDFQTTSYLCEIKRASNKKWNMYQSS